MQTERKSKSTCIFLRCSLISGLRSRTKDSAKIWVNEDNADLFAIFPYATIERGTHAAFFLPGLGMNVKKTRHGCKKPFTSLLSSRVTDPDIQETADRVYPP